LLFGQYRKGDANDPETYVATIAAILAEFPEETVRYVTDPRTGLASNPIPDPETGKVWTGMPNPAEVKQACQKHLIDLDRRRSLDEWQEKKRKSDEIKRLYGRAENKPTTGISYDEFLKRCAESGENPRPKGRFE
jgi:hypothetical protein